MTKHTMTVQVDIDVDEGDVINYASEILADRVEKNAWYHKIRAGVDKMVLREVQDGVKARVQLCLDRGVTDHASEVFAVRAGAQNARTGDGGDWHDTISIEQLIFQQVELCVQNHVAFIAERQAEAEAARLLRESSNA